MPHTDLVLWGNLDSVHVTMTVPTNLFTAQSFII